MAVATKLVELIKKDKAAIIRIQNVARNNELSSAVLMQLSDILSQVKNDSEVEVVVITGQGLFSVGASVEEIWQISQQGNAEKARELLTKANDIVNAIQDLGKPTIAAIERFCLGGGNEIAMACSYRIATANAKFGQPEIKLGIIPGMGGTQRLPRLINVYEAAELLLSGDIIGAERAKALGLIDQLVPDGTLIDTVKEYLARPLMDIVKDRHQLRQNIRKLRVENGFGEICSIEAESRVEHALTTPKIAGLLKSNSHPKAAEAVASLLSCIAWPLEKALEEEQKVFAQLVVKEEAQAGLAKFLKKPMPTSGQAKTQQTQEMKAVAAEPNEDEIKAMREMIRDFAKKSIEPKIAQMEKEGRIFPEIIKEMADLGLFGIAFPEKYGGTGLGLPGFCVMMEEISRVHGSTAALVGAHVSLACKAVYLFGNEDQKQRYLVSGIKGEKIGCYATTEPSVGSDLANIQTSAKKVEGGWVINGTKQFITSGAIADFAIVLAQTDPMGSNRTQAMFIVDTDSKGFITTKVNEEKIGLHASCTSAFAMDEMFVPDANLLGEVGQGFKVAMNVFNQSRISLGAGCLGAVKSALEEAILFVKDHQIGGEPLYMKQLIQAKLAEIEMIRYTMEVLVYHTARLYERNPEVRKEAAVVKYMAAELLDKAVSLSLQIHGGAGYIEDYKIARLYRDSRVNRIFEGTSEVQLLLVAKELLKENL